MVSSLIEFIQSHKQREFVYILCLGIKKSVKEDLSLLSSNFFPETTECTFKTYPPSYGNANTTKIDSVPACTDYILHNLYTPHMVSCTVGHTARYVQ